MLTDMIKIILAQFIGSIDQPRIDQYHDDHDGSPFPIQNYLFTKPAISFIKIKARIDGDKDFIILFF